jgi:acetolactate synthase I/II/III large subunit
MTGSELFTIASYKLPVICVIINNSGLGMIRQLQQVFFAKRYTACELPPTVDFTLFAAAFGVHAVAAGTWQDFTQAFKAALASPNPEVIVANIATEDMVSPMTPPGGAINAYIDI